MRYIGMVGVVGFLACTSDNVKTIDTIPIPDTGTDTDTGTTIDTSDTGDTGDTQEPLPTGCSATLTPEDIITFEDSWMVGPFEGSFSESGFRIGYQNYPGHIVVETSGNWLSSDFGSLEVDEHQGSFDISS